MREFLYGRREVRNCRRRAAHQGGLLQLDVDLVLPGIDRVDQTRRMGRVVFLWGREPPLYHLAREPGLPPRFGAWTHPPRLPPNATIQPPRPRPDVAPCKQPSGSPSAATD